LVNVLLSQLLNAECLHYPDGEDEIGADQALRTKAEELSRRGRVPYVIPLGIDNPPLGALGYMQCALEILSQKADFDALVVATGSGLTHAGVLAGLRLEGSNIPVFGICVRRSAEQQRNRIGRVLEQLAQLLVIPNPVSLSDIRVWDGALAPGYGQLNSQSVEAMKTMAQLEGLFLDPVYTAKSFAGVSGLLEAGLLQPGMRVLYLHTGGQAAIFGYVEALSKL